MYSLSAPNPAPESHDPIIHHIYYINISISKLCHLNSALQLQYGPQLNQEQTSACDSKHHTHKHRSAVNICMHDRLKWHGCVTLLRLTNPVSFAKALKTYLEIQILQASVFCCWCCFFGKATICHVCKNLFRTCPEHFSISLTLTLQKELLNTWLVRWCVRAGKYHHMLEGWGPVIEIFSKEQIPKPIKCSCCCKHLGNSDKDCNINIIIFNGFKYIQKQNIWGSWCRKAWSLFRMITSNLLCTCYECVQLFSAIRPKSVCFWVIVTDNS